MPTIGPLEIVMVVIIVLVVFGPKRLPGLGKSAGKGVREFKEVVSLETEDTRAVGGEASGVAPTSSAQPVPERSARAGS